MFLLKTNGKKWSNSEVSVLQGNRGRFTQHLTQCLKHTVVFPHEFYPPEHSEEHTADNNARSIIHSLPNFISSPLFLNVLTHAVHVRSQRATHTYTKRATSRAHTPNTDLKPWKRTPGQTALWFPEEPPWMSCSWREVHVMPVVSRDGERVGQGGGRISSYWRGTGRRGPQDGKYFNLIGDINSRLILSFTLWSYKISVWWFITATVSDTALKNSPLQVNIGVKESGVSCKTW